MSALFPINGETFLPQLLADYLSSQRTAAALPEGLVIAAAPIVVKFTTPMLVIGCPSFTTPTHPGIGEYDLHFQLHTAKEKPADGEDEAAANARRQADLAAENRLIATLRLMLALRETREWQRDPLDATTKVISLFTWINTVRTVPADEDGWNLVSFILGGGGGLTYMPQDHYRVRFMLGHARLYSNEFAG